ncbi:GbsR/MarR family transcriptional regulator [Gracilibacillus alcaliphilus]|uniref:GbsR/MarR family transcriptional regulator n=1 Tax=Gracilibacillus alcaliphilus TaxID=1401441 RepID=UPI00195AD242|nr:GbsR/MarR family transcriptional regulator [Gracilibacillus alcaliphilus]MBM7678607.1 DNA-binding transcriptional regulator GbsR (MarR family) [Gracilibacillus alcaliphilus]
MSNQDEMITDVETQFIEKITDNMNGFGAPTSVGRVLGIIYMNREPMTLDELAAETGMSKTRMSQVVREMIDMNIAERVFKKGIRKDLYQVETDYYETFISLFTSTWRKAINRNRQFEKRLTKSIDQLMNNDELTDENEQKINELLAELHQWKEYYDWIRRVNDFFESGEIFKHVPKQADDHNTK